MNKRPLFVICIFFILGIALAIFLPDLVKFSHIFIIALISILSSSVFFKHQKVSSIFLLLSVTLFAALLYINSNIFPQNHISRFLDEGKIKTSIVGIIKSPVLTRRPYFGKINSIYLFEIEGIKTHDEWLGIKGLTQIRIETESDFKYGDRLFVKGTIKKPYWEYLARQNIYALINTKEGNVTVLSNNYKVNTILNFIYKLRHGLKNQILEKMPLYSGAFLRAILLGDRSELPEHIKTSFKHSGTIHILAISGLHIGLIAFFVFYLLKILRIKREVYYIFTVLFLICFAFLTLLKPSVVRGVVMASVFLVGMLIGRRVDVYNSLGIAALFILIRNPKELFNVGFQLSFLAVLSILFFAPKFTKLISKNTNFYVNKFLYTPFLVSVSAWLGTCIPILYYFKIITPIAIISNIFVVPLVFVLLIGGMGFLLLGWVPFIGPFLAGFNAILANLMFSLTDFFASFRFGHWYL